MHWPSANVKRFKQAYQTVRHTIEDCGCLEDKDPSTQGRLISEMRASSLRDAQLVPKTVGFMLATVLSLGSVYEFRKDAFTTGVRCESEQAGIIGGPIEHPWGLQF